jgi:hypothetical protein
MNYMTWNSRAFLLILAMLNAIFFVLYGMHLLMIPVSLYKELRKLLPRRQCLRKLRTKQAIKRCNNLKNCHKVILFGYWINCLYYLILWVSKFALLLLFHVITIWNWKINLTNVSKRIRSKILKWQNSIRFIQLNSKSTYKKNIN